MSDVTKKITSAVEDMATPGSAIFNLAVSHSEEATGKATLRGFLDQMSSRGFQIQSNFCVTLDNVDGFQFYCQSINVPDLKTHNGELYYKCRAIQVPIAFEQGHDFQMTVINDAGSHIYHGLRELCRRMYVRDRRSGTGLKTINTGVDATIKARSDQKFTFGSEVKLKNLRITNVSGLQFG